MPATGDPFKYVQSGQPLKLPAEAWNAFIDTTRAFRAQQRPQSGKPADRPQMPPGFCYVLNTTEDDLGQFAVLGIDDAMFAPGTAPEQFAEQVGFAGVEPTADHVGNGKFVILLEPAASLTVALACVAGATVCKINVSNGDHEFADAAAGTSDALVSASAGTVEILWKESGTGDGKWAIVRFAVSLLVRVRISGDGGYGAGKYAGNIVRPPTSNIASAGALAAADLGSTGDAVVIVNAQEIGGSGHWLTNAANTNQKDFIGVMLGVQCDDKPVVQIGGAWFQAC